MCTQLENISSTKFFYIWTLYSIETVVMVPPTSLILTTFCKHAPVHCKQDVYNGSSKVENADDPSWMDAEILCMKSCL